MAIYNGTDGADTIWGSAGNNLIDGKGGDDLLYGGDGNDTLIGGPGIDTLVGGRGDDIYYVTSYKDVILEKPSEGTDTVYSNVNYQLPANVENIHLSGIATSVTGNALSNTIWDETAAAPGKVVTIEGGGGGDRIHGGDADNVIHAGPHNGLDVAYLWGGGGADRFVFNTGDLGSQRGATAEILDFSSAQGDKIDLTGFDAIPGGGHDSFSFIGQAAFTGEAGQLHVKTVYDGGSGGEGQPPVLGPPTYILEGDLDGDKHADIALVLDSHLPSAGDLIL